MKRLKLLVIDSHDSFWMQAAPKLRTESAIDVIVLGAVTPSTLAQVDSLAAHVVAVDIAFPAPANVELMAQLAWRSPAVPVIGLCQTVDDARLSLALAAGARACMGRDSAADHMARTIAEVASGGFPLQEELVRRPSLLGEMVIELQRRLRGTYLQDQSAESAPRCPLTERELVILEMVAAGRANKEIAESLEIAERTVKNHIANILDKLAARGRAHAVALAIENRWICKREPQRQAALEGAA
ncbi:MAG: response regulator transcription factor [Chloroflexi bacterium]|nr:response regulator transcription factor [Chloroflexota bacterium]